MENNFTNCKERFTYQLNIKTLPNFHKLVKYIILKIHNIGNCSGLLIINFQDNDINVSNVCTVKYYSTIHNIAECAQKSMKCSFLAFLLSNSRLGSKRRTRTEYVLNFRPEASTYMEDKKKATRSLMRPTHFLRGRSRKKSLKIILQ